MKKFLVFVSVFLTLCIATSQIVHAQNCTGGKCIRPHSGANTFTICGAGYFLDQDNDSCQGNSNGSLVCCPTEADEEEVDTHQFDLCAQIPESDERSRCQQCAISGGVWTAVGCINTSAESIISKLIKVGLGMAGGVALIMILAAGFQYSTSQGEPKRTSEAKELLTSAVIGLLFIILSVTILQFIGVTILRIPGFGG